MPATCGAGAWNTNKTTAKPHKSLFNGPDPVYRHGFIAGLTPLEDSRTY